VISEGILSHRTLLSNYKFFIILKPFYWKHDRYGPIEYSPELWSFEEATEEEGGGQLTASTSTTDDEEDSDPLNADWESVILNIRQRST
jgi:hypothetical protein